MFRSPLFIRQFGILCGFGLSVAIALGLWSAHQVRSTRIASAEEQLLREAQLVARTLPDSSLPAADRAEVARTIALQLNRRVTWVAPDGGVLADSAVPEALENHGQRPEIRAAMAAGRGAVIRRSATLREDMLYVAVRCGPESAPTGVLRLAVGVAHLQDDVRADYRRITWGVLWTVVAGAVAAALLARRSASTWRHVARGAQALANGQFAHRTPIEPSSGLAPVAEALNDIGRRLDDLTRRIAADRQQLRVVMSSLIEGVVVVDGTDTVRLINEAAAHLLAIGGADPEGRPLRDVLSQADILGMVAAVRREGVATHARVGATQAAFDLEVSICPLAGATGDQGLILVVHDVAESARYRELRTEFVTNAAHELRTPLSLIRGFVETLQHSAKDDPANRDRFLGLVERNAQQLANLVDDLLTLSELEERRRLSERCAVDLVTVLTRCLQQLQPAADAKHQRLTFEGPATPIVILGDDRALERAFANLLDNAIKYTPEEGWIQLKAEHDGVVATVTVEDTGLGIPEADQPRIFERFYRVDKSRSRALGGTGLGLSIVKHVVDAHGGHIRVESRPGCGARFIATFPLDS